MTRKMAMDRVFEISARINEQWIKINTEIRRLSLIHGDEKQLKDIYNRLNKLQSDFANLISMAQDNSWRILAEANGVILPDEAVENIPPREGSDDEPGA